MSFTIEIPLTDKGVNLYAYKFIDSEVNLLESECWKLNIVYTYPWGENSTQTTKIKNNEIKEIKIDYIYTFLRTDVTKQSNETSSACREDNYLLYV